MMETVHWYRGIIGGKAAFEISENQISRYMRNLP